MTCTTCSSCWLARQRHWCPNQHHPHSELPSTLSCHIPAVVVVVVVVVVPALRSHRLSAWLVSALSFSRRLFGSRTIVQHSRNLPSTSNAVGGCRVCSCVAGSCVVCCCIGRAARGHVGWWGPRVNRISLILLTLGGVCPVCLLVLVAHSQAVSQFGVSVKCCQ
jgi:hypothetical protein